MKKFSVTNRFWETVFLAAAVLISLLCVFAFPQMERKSSEKNKISQKQAAEHFSQKLLAVQRELDVIGITDYRIEDRDNDAIELTASTDGGRNCKSISVTMYDSEGKEHYSVKVHNRSKNPLLRLCLTKGSWILPAG